MKEQDAPAGPVPGQVSMRNPLGPGNTSSSFGERGIAKRLDMLGRRATLRGQRLLDIGCGDGAYTLRLATGFDHVDAVDVQPGPLTLLADRIEQTPGASKITVAQMSAARLDFPGNHFDVVTCVEVLEHVTELDSALSEIRRVLKPGGTFACTTPNRWFPFETHGFLFRGRRYPPAWAPFLTWIGPLHRRLADARTFTAGDLRHRLRTAGLVPVSVDYLMPPFDRSRLGNRIRPVTDRMEHSPLRWFGMALAVTAHKPGSD